MNFLKLVFLFSLLSCNFNDQSRLNKKDEISLLFTGNINAEIEPCGCRQFPLGGIDNLYTVITEERKNASVIFIDTGDSFYQANFIPNDEEKSSFAKAKAVSEGLDLLKLDYKALGDQDLSNGLDKLAKLINESNYKIIASNLKDESKIPHQKHDEFVFHKHHFFIIGVTHPETVQKEYYKYFISPEQGIKKQLKVLEEKYDSTNPYHHLILLSHSGQEKEIEYAKSFPQIDWILGSHSMNFTQKPIQIKETKLAQMLSRNHYIGKINFKKNAHDSSYSTIEIGPELAKKISNNPVTEFIKKKKKVIDEIQVSEQSSSNSNFYSIDRIPTATSCIDCHDAQGTFWQKTSHSLAYITLKNSTKNHDLDCLKCHSLGVRNPKGYTDSNDIVIVDDNENYWKEVFSKSAPKESIRELQKDEIYRHSKAWYNIDLKYGVEHNYANVQCLNCHQLPMEHLNLPSKHKSSGKDGIKNACLKCHTPDQSTHWYSNGALNEEIFEKSYKKVSCPKVID